MPMTDYDVIVVGGGVVGCAAARELARYRCRVALVERAEDVCAGTSKANSAIVHAGFDAKPGTAKARFNLLGNRRWNRLPASWILSLFRNGSLVLCLDEADRPKLAALAARGLQNGVPGLRLLTGEEARRLEPNLSARCVCGAVRADRRHCLPVRADHCAGRKRLRQRGGLSLFDRRDSRSPHGRRLPA